MKLLFSVCVASASLVSALTVPAAGLRKDAVNNTKPFYPADQPNYVPHKQSVPLPYYLHLRLHRALYHLGVYRWFTRTNPFTLGLA